jgi:hypothetical protein
LAVLHVVASHRRSRTAMRCAGETHRSGVGWGNEGSGCASSYRGGAAELKWTPFFRQGVKVDSKTGKESRNGSSESSSFQGVVQG